MKNKNVFNKTPKIILILSIMISVVMVSMCINLNNNPVPQKNYDVHKMSNSTPIIVPGKNGTFWTIFYSQNYGRLFYSSSMNCIEWSTPILYTPCKDSCQSNSYYLLSDSKEDFIFISYRNPSLKIFQSQDFNKWIEKSKLTFNINIIITSPIIVQDNENTYYLYYHLYSADESTDKIVMQSSKDLHVWGKPITIVENGPGGIGAYNKVFYDSNNTFWLTYEYAYYYSGCALLKSTNGINYTSSNYTVKSWLGNLIQTINGTYYLIGETNTTDDVSPREKNNTEQNKYIYCMWSSNDGEEWVPHTIDLDVGTPKTRLMTHFSLISDKNRLILIKDDWEISGLNPSKIWISFSYDGIIWTSSQKIFQ